MTELVFPDDYQRTYGREVPSVAVFFLLTSSQSGLDRNAFLWAGAEEITLPLLVMSGETNRAGETSRKGTRLLFLPRLLEVLGLAAALSSSLIITACSQCSTASPLSILNQAGTELISPSSPSSCLSACWISCD